MQPIAAPCAMACAMSLSFMATKQCSPCLRASTRGCTAGSPIKSKGQRISRRAWLVSVGVTGALAASAICAAALDRFVPRPLSEMSQPARRLPERLVAIVDGGKMFHVPGCPFMHGKYHMVTAQKRRFARVTPLAPVACVTHFGVPGMLRLTSRGKKARAVRRWKNDGARAAERNARGF